MHFTSKPHDDRCLGCCNPDPCDCDEEFNYHNYGYQSCPNGSWNGGYETRNKCGKEWRTEKAKPRLTRAAVVERALDSFLEERGILEFKEALLASHESELRRIGNYHKAKPK